jgi:hypothetical protein
MHRDAERIITFMPATPISRTIRVGAEVILEPGSPVIWFTYPGQMHDIGIFHDAAGAFTGYYANILTPVVFHTALEWETTDLFLDVWLGRSGRGQLLDEDELAAAVEKGWLTGTRRRGESGGRPAAGRDRGPGVPAGGRARVDTGAGARPAGWPVTARRARMTAAGTRARGPG